MATPWLPVLHITDLNTPTPSAAATASCSYPGLPVLLKQILNPTLRGARCVSMAKSPQGSPQVHTSPVSVSTTLFMPPHATCTQTHTIPAVWVLATTLCTCQSTAKKSDVL